MLSVCLLVALAGCDVNNDGVGTAGPSGVAVAGGVQAPAGALAKVAAEKSWLASLFSVTESWAIDIAGWTGVSGATVRVFTIDNDGVPSGSVLATGGTTPDGSFSLSLPTGTSFAGNLIAQVENDAAITGPMPVGTPNTLSVPVVSGTVNVNPATAAATVVLVNRPEPLSNFTPAEVAQYLAASEALVADNPPAAATTGGALTQIAATFGSQFTAALNVLSGTGASAPVILTASLPNGTQNSPYGKTVVAVGGTGALTWDFADGSLVPSGLSLNATTGSISGTPTVPVASANLHLRVRDASAPAQSATQALSLTIAPLAPPSVTTAALPNGQVGVAYNTPLAATGGTPGYVWGLASGSNPLPSGLVLNPSGVIAGTPSGAAAVQIIVQVTDNAGVTAARTLSVTITASGPQPLTITTSRQLPQGVVDAPYSVTFQATGGTPPYTWFGGPYAGGFTLGASTGVLTGTATAPSNFSFTVGVRDSGSPQQTYGGESFSASFVRVCSVSEIAVANEPSGFGGAICPTRAPVIQIEAGGLRVSFSWFEEWDGVRNDVGVVIDNASGQLISASTSYDVGTGPRVWQCSMIDFSLPACSNISVSPQSGIAHFSFAPFTYQGFPHNGVQITLNGSLTFPAFTLPLQPPPSPE